MFEKNTFELAPIIKKFVKIGKVDINKSLALSFLCNDENLYINSNKNFLNSTSELMSLLDKSYNEKNYIDSETTIHRIKGYAYYIGSQFLFDFSNYLCTKIKGLDEKVLKKKNNKLDKEINLFIEYFKLIIIYKRKEIENV